MNTQTIEEILREYATPAYVFDLDALRERVETIQKCLQQKQVKLCYAMKANPFLVGAMEGLVERFEVCSPGEFRICERQKLPIEHLVISGVNKEPADMFRIAAKYQGRGIFTVESLQQLELLASCARESGYPLKVLVRISSGNQFGVDFEQAKEVFASKEKYPGLRFLGIQYYSGTQKKLAMIQRELEKLDGWILELQKQGAQISELEYGPGFCVPYFQTDSKECLEEQLKDFMEFIRQMKFQGKLTLEMGRFLTADCGSFLTTLVERKETGGQIYGIVDGGIHHINYYGQTMAMKLPFVQYISRGGAAWNQGMVQLAAMPGVQKPGTQTEEKWNICGSLCTTADVIVKQLPLTGVQVGDVLVFERTGAYSVTEGINLFLSRDLPSVLCYSKKQGVRCLRKSQPTDMLNGPAIET